MAVIALRWIWKEMLRRSKAEQKNVPLVVFAASEQGIGAMKSIKNTHHTEIVDESVK